MKNTRYFPFERNKYFYGKLLSVDDFELEQRYVNNKRRMANRFLHGAGVVAGLHVVRIDERTVSVENGFALDALGREIVVDTPAICKLPLLEGYEECARNGAKDYVYLCLDYDEEETGVVHNVAGSVVISDEDRAYNKIKETYRLYLSDDDLKQERQGKSVLYEQEQVIYSQSGIKIKLVVPKYVTAGGTGEIRLEIENLSKEYLAFSFQLLLDYLDFEGKSAITVSFNEMQYEKTGNYTLVYEVTAADLTEAKAAVRLDEKRTEMFLNKEKRSFSVENVVFLVQLVQGDIREHIVSDYYRSAMDQIVKWNQQERLYLAKIYLMRVGDDIVIDRVDNLPFEQSILNQNLSFALHQLTIDGYGAKDGRKKRKLRSQDGGWEVDDETNVRVSQGSIWLDLNGGGQRGDRFISEEVPHGLGIGSAIMYVGLENEDGVTTYGSSEIFEDMDLMLELAVRVYPERGTFQVAGRLREQVICSGVNVHWAAIMPAGEKVKKTITRKIFIKPSVLELKTRESYYLEAICENMEDTSVTWSVQDHGGTISENGMYTAPNSPGVYEVVAKSAAYPDVKASIFVVVRDA